MGSCGGSQLLQLGFQLGSLRLGQLVCQQGDLVLLHLSLAR